MEIDFIKWMIGYAEGFILGIENSVTYQFNDGWELVRNITKVETWEHCPLLLQKAIEGIETNKYIEILAYWNKSGKCYESQVFRTESDFPTLGVTYTDFKSIDKAKEQALKYIYEQETKA